MISLEIQIKSLIFSFLYGCIFYLFLSLNNKNIYNSKGIIKILTNIFFIFDNVLLYFIILKKINNGILHYYFIFSIILGYLSVKKVISVLNNIDKKTA